MKQLNIIRRTKKILNLILKYSSYNLKIIFANKFIYFLLAALIFFLAVTAIIFFSSDSYPDSGSVFNLLLFPAILLIFYPAVFGLQNDIDTGMIEVLFAIPNYRYSVWLVRLVLMYVITAGLVAVLAVLSAVIIVPVPVISMVCQIMFPVFFLGSLAFLLSSLIKNGNGTAVVMVIIGLALWVSAGWLHHSKWFLFLNPFSPPTDMSESVWSDIVLKNRVYMVVGAVISTLAGLFNLQKREKFV
ncbi:MAG: hypothetical protein U5O15_06385 [Candidatus Krumholzibacteriota bacterium]|nr:hypothetical protein [Candidatus Krumholzibacteriota bacterium]